MKRVISLILSLALCFSLCAVSGVIAYADDIINQAANVMGGHIEFRNDADNPWVYDTTMIGRYCAATDTCGKDGTSTTLSATLDFAQGQAISFWWRASCENKWDTFTFSVDGKELVTITGDIAWENKIYPIDEGEHTVSWTYTKDASYAMYNDRGYVDDVEIISYSKSTNIDDYMNSRSETLVFENDEAYPWTSYEYNTRMVKSNIEGKNNTSTAVSTHTVLSKDQVVSFNWGVSCEENWDKLVFEVNGEVIKSITGSVVGRTERYLVPEDGEYTFRWVYIKDAQNDIGDDCAKIGSVRISEKIDVTGVIIVKKAIVRAGSQITLASSIRPSTATNRDVTWSSSDESIATVDNNGVVKGVSAGICTLTATTVEGGFTAQCILTVNDFEGVYTYYVNGAYGSDGNNGRSSGSAVKTLAAAVARARAMDVDTATIVILTDVQVAEPTIISDININIVPNNSKMNFNILRAPGYEGEIFRITYNGGLYLGGGPLDSSISVGKSSAKAPAVYVESGELQLYGNASIVNNTSTVSGAAVYVKNGSFTMVGGEIYGNVTERFGGGVYNENGSILIAGGSVAGNTANIDAGGIFSEERAEATIDTSVVTGNTSAGEHQDIYIGIPDDPDDPDDPDNPDDPDDPDEKHLSAIAFISDSDSGKAGSVVLFDVYDCQVVSSIPFMGLYVSAGETVTGREIYGYTEDNVFFAVTGDPVATLSDSPADYTVMDMTYNYRTATMFALVSDEENTRYIAGVNLSDGSLSGITKINVTEETGPMMTLAADSAGKLYGISGGDDAGLFSIAADGTAVLIGYTGLPCAYFQSASFDKRDNTLYWAQCSDEGCGLYRVDTATGKVKLVGKLLGDETELTMLILPYEIDTETEHYSEDGIYIYKESRYGGIEITGLQEGARAMFPSYIETLVVEIPSEIDGYTVKSLGRHCFAEKAATEPKLTGVIIPDTVEQIGYGAFRGCSKLTYVQFGGNEKIIGDYAFYQCSSLGEVTVPESVRELAYGAFAGCSALSKITVTNDETEFDEYLFYETPEEFTIYGNWPSTAYDYARENNINFADIGGYNPPVVSGAEDGAVYLSEDIPEGISITWECGHEVTWNLNGEEYVSGTPVTEPGKYVFFISDGRTDVTVSFEIRTDSYMKGDFDGDGAITVADALAALRIGAKLVEEDEQAIAIGDVDNDGHVTVADALAILRVAARLTDSF